MKTYESLELSIPNRSIWSVSALLDLQARTRPDKPFVVWEGVENTYAEVDEAANHNALARRAHKIGAIPREPGPRPQRAGSAQLPDGLAQAPKRQDYFVIWGKSPSARRPMRR